MTKAIGQTEYPGVLSRTRLKRAGGSLVVTVPASARNLLALSEGQEMDVSVEDGRVVLEPVGRPTHKVRSPRYTLEELIADVEPDARTSDADHIWLDEPPKGREVW